MEHERGVQIIRQAVRHAVVAGAAKVPDREGRQAFGPRPNFRVARSPARAWLPQAARPWAACRARSSSCGSCSAAGPSGDSAYLPAHIAARPPAIPHARAVRQPLQLLQQRDVLVPQLEVVTGGRGAGTVDAAGRTDNLLGIRKLPREGDLADGHVDVKSNRSIASAFVSPAACLGKATRSFNGAA